MLIVPLSIKLSIVVGMGILVSMIGMVSVGLVVANDKTLVGLGDLSDEVRLCARAEATSRKGTFRGVSSLSADNYVRSVAPLTPRPFPAPSLRPGVSSARRRGSSSPCLASSSLAAWFTTT